MWGEGGGVTFIVHLFIRCPYDITQLDDKITGVKPIFLLVTPTTFKCLFCSILFSHLTNIKYKKSLTKRMDVRTIGRADQLPFEPRHDKTNKMSVRPAKTDQPWHPPSLPSEDRSARASAQSDQSSLCAQRVAKDPSFLHADSEDS